MHLEHTFLCISLRLFCTTATWDFQKLPSYTFYWGNFICGPVHVFRCRSFLTWWPLVFLIFSCTAAIKFSCYSSNEIGLLCFFISGSSSFFVIHANKDIKINSKERIGFVVVVFLSQKVRVSIWCTAERAGTWNAKFHLRLPERVDVRRDDLVRTKISWMHRLPNFLTHGGSLLNYLFTDF